MRFIAYLIPILPLSSLLFAYIFDFFLQEFLENKRYKLLNLFTIIFLFYFVINSYHFYVFYKTFTTSFTVRHVIQSAYVLKKSVTYLSTKKFEKEIVNGNKNIIYSITLPISNNLYQKSTNTWQVPNQDIIKTFSPDYLFIDFTVYWEKPYEYWKNIATQNNLKKEKLFIGNAEKEKNIVLFYK